jgi:hypothetical protein
MVVLRGPVDYSCKNWNLGVLRGEWEKLQGMLPEGTHIRVPFGG